jgi:hypothetical protein
MGHHVDHVVTEAEERAAQRVMEAEYADDEPRVPFHELFRDEQRKALRIVRDGDVDGDRPLHQRSLRFCSDPAIPRPSRECQSLPSSTCR